MCQMNNIKPICLIRRAEQEELLRKEFQCEFVVDTSKADYKQKLGDICAKLKPNTCFECISGNTTGEMLQYLTFNSTLILYGTLSETPAGGIQTIHFIGKSQTIESFLLNTFLARYDEKKFREIVAQALKTYKTVFKTTVQKRFGFD